LEDVARILLAHVDLIVEIQGHADPSEGKAARRLSELRAKAVRAALIARGIDGSTLVPVGYGSEKPLAGPAESGRTINPRVRFHVVDAHQ
jgi:OOP family OmpA-OmpF porin